MSRLALTAAVTLTAVLIAACGGADEGGTANAPPSREESTARDGGAPADRDPGAGETAQTVTPSRCPPGVADCRSTEGVIVYVERVDPDGDGDAHFVVADPQGITLRGLTVIDVRAGLRPSPLPGPGELISAAGPVQTGSYGQSQIHALELHVAGRD